MKCNIAILALFSYIAMTLAQDNMVIGKKVEKTDLFSHKNNKW